MGLRRFKLLNILGNLINPSTEDKQDDAISNQTDGTQRTKIYANGEDVDVQHPLPTDGESVYAKDINESSSDVGTFAGAITSLVDDLDTTFSSTGHSSPANFSITLKRPIQNTGIKFCSPAGKNFSNAKLTLKDKSGALLFVVDESSDGTKKTNEEYFWPHLPWCTILVQFYTTDDIDINWALLEKSVLVHSSIKFLDKRNSTTTPLVGDDSWTGEWIKTTDYQQAIVNISTDKDAAVDGLELQLSDDGVNIRHTHAFTPLTNTPNGHHYPSTLDMQYLRIKYTNGSETQSTFALFTTLFSSAVEEGHAHGLDYPLKDDHPASIVRAVQTGKKPNGEYVNAQYTTAGNPKAAIEEIETEVSEQINKYPVGASSNGSVTLTDANTAYAIPASAPTGSYVMNINSLDDVSIFVGYEDSNANGMEFMAGDPPARISLGADQQIYVYCASAGKVVSYTLKEIN